MLHYFNHSASALSSREASDFDQILTSSEEASALPARPEGLNILAYGLNYAPELTGIGKYSSELCEWLAARGHKVEVVTGPPYYPTWTLPEGFNNRSYSKEVRSDVVIRRCPMFLPRFPLGKGRLLGHATFAMSSLPNLMVSAHRNRPDVLLAVTPSFLVTPAALAASKIFGIPSWLHVQDFEVDAAFELGMLEGNGFRRAAMSIESFVLKQFDRVSTISPRMLDRLAAKGVSPERTVEFRNWVDTDEIRPADRRTDFRKQLGLSEQSIVALYAGSIAAKQGIERLVEAAAELQATAPEIVFVFCGAGAQLNHLREIAAPLSNIRFLDLQPNARMRELLATADIHLIPQRSQVADLMLPSKVAPILASGRPVVAMADPGTQLASEIEGAGVAVSTSNRAELTAAILTLAKDEQLRARLGEAGRALACERWRKTFILEEFETRLIQLARSGRKNVRG